MLSSPLKPEMWFSFSILGGRCEVIGYDFSVIILPALSLLGFFLGRILKYPFCTSAFNSLLQKCH